MSSQIASDDDPIKWQDVHNEEYKTLMAARKNFGCDDSDPISALCLSGGGIRSATFSLGVLQGLAKAGLLKKFDYLSTVSGGGYIGSWLTRWISHSNLDTVNDELAKESPSEQSGPEPEPISHLRAYSNYLTPKINLLDADVWSLIATFFRNMLLNWTVLLPLLAALLMVPRFFLAAVRISPPPLAIVQLFVAVGLLLLAYAVLCEGKELPSFGDGKGARKTVFLCFLSPIVASAMMLTTAWAWYANATPQLGDYPWQLYFAMLGTGLHTVGWGVSFLSSKKTMEQGTRLFSVKTHFLVATAVSGAIGGCLTYLAADWLFGFAQHDPVAYFCLAFPTFLTVLLLAGLLHVGLVSSITEEEDREWWARSAGAILIAAVAWLVIVPLVFYGPELFLPGRFHPWKTGTLSATGILSGLLTAWAGHNRSTSATSKRDEKFMQKAINIGITVMACLFILVFLALLSLGTTWLINGFELPRYAEYDGFLVQSGFRDLLTVSIAYIAVCAVMGRYIDINRFSLHCMYRNRLIRAYLGACRAPEKRKHNPFTGFDPLDNIPLSDLPARPFHVVNVALNLVHDENLAWQQRKAATFTMSRSHAGNRFVGYRPIDRYGSIRNSHETKPMGLTLGTAVAISGAAASPNMGYHSSPHIAFIMALFNMRLGWWLGNPKASTWKKNGPSLSSLPLFKEMFGLTSDHAGYVYLSDGGHFENLGLYEMVQRHCRFIVVVDAGCDPSREFEDLGNALRKIRIDFGIAIDIDIEPVLRGNKHCAVGEIDYQSQGDAKAKPGRLVYIKPWVCGNEPADVQNYQKINKDFPHESTADQWFTETQFESYRMLGFHAIEEILGFHSKTNPGNRDWNCGSLDSFFASAQKYLQEKNVASQCAFMAASENQA